MRVGSRVVAKTSTADPHKASHSGSDTNSKPSCWEGGASSCGGEDAPTRNLLRTITLGAAMNKHALRGNLHREEKRKKPKTEASTCLTQITESGRDAPTQHTHPIPYTCRKGKALYRRKMLCTTRKARQPRRRE
ncbi:hypothetical protein U1Q18_052500 [Sarracenia purpurea var. burkii]